MNRITIGTVLRYLGGSRDAIIQIACTPSAVWLGALFVLSAGFAREYDGADLTHEPWHVLIPLGVSLVTSFLLFSLIACVIGFNNLAIKPFLSKYRSFLSLYWMTAPLAWLYAVPIEYFASPEAATRFNLTMLAVVSLWRVLLITRAVRVLFMNGTAAFWTVMLFADTVLMVILFTTPLPIFDIMGGIRMAPREQLIRDVATNAIVLGVLSWPIWLIGMVTAARISRDRVMDPPKCETPGSVARQLWIVAGLALAVWLAILPLTQGQQRLRYEVETALEDGRVAEGIAIMSRHNRQDFPPHWDPPPRRAYYDPNPPLLDVMAAIVDHGAADWVQRVYYEKWGPEDVRNAGDPIIEQMRKAVESSRERAREPEKARDAPLQTKPADPSFLDADKPLSPPLNTDDPLR